MSWSAWRTSANHHSPLTSPAVFRDFPQSTPTEGGTTSSKGEENRAFREWRSLNFNWILSLVAVFQFTLQWVNIPNCIHASMGWWSSSWFCCGWNALISFFTDIRNYWTPTRPPTTSSAAPCVGWLSAWTSSASLLSLVSHFLLSSCTIRYLQPPQASLYHTQCRFVNKHMWYGDTGNSSRLKALKRR